LGEKDLREIAKAQMDRVLKIVRRILEERRDTVWVPIRQRCSFEGWLKIELARALEEEGFVNVKLEEDIVGQRVDIVFKSCLNDEDIRFLLNLKICLTGWWRNEWLSEDITYDFRYRRGRGTTNVRGVLEDIDKVNFAAQFYPHYLGIVLMLLCPISIEHHVPELKERIKHHWRSYEDQLLREPHLREVVRIKGDVGVAIFLFGPYGKLSGIHPKFELS